MLTQTYEKLVKIYLKLKVLKKGLKCTCKHIKFKMYLSTIQVHVLVLKYIYYFKNVLKYKVH